MPSTHTLRRLGAFLVSLAVLVAGPPARADEPKSDPGPAPEGIVLVSVGGVGMGAGLGVMLAGALSNVSFVPGGSGCEQYREARAVNDCRRRHDDETARDDAKASVKIRNGAIVTGIGGVVLGLGVMILVSSMRPATRKEPTPTAGVEVRIFPDVAGVERAQPAAGLAVEMPLVGGTF